MKPKSLLLNQLPVPLWMLCILMMSSIRGGGTGIERILAFDKVLHGAAYFILCGLVARALILQNSSKFLAAHALSVAFLFSYFFGILDEIYQLYVPGRSSSPLDFFADIAGAGLYCAIHWTAETRARKRAQKSPLQQAEGYKQRR